MCDKHSYFHLLSKEQAFRRENSKSLSWSVFHCCVGICLFVILCAFLHERNIFSILTDKHGTRATYVWHCTHFGFAAWFSFALFAGFLDGFPVHPLLWNGHLSLHLHPASSLLGEQLRMDARQNATIWYGHPSEQLFNNIEKLTH